MFAYVEALNENQLRVLNVIIQTELQIEDESNPSPISTQIKQSELATNLNCLEAAKIIKQLYKSGYICNSYNPDGLGFEFTTSGEISVFINDPIILTPKGRGYLNTKDLLMQIIEKAAEQSKLPEEEKQSFLKKVYKEVSDKGLDFVAKLITETYFRQQ
jgi:predicted transcriptional regulator